jgi:DNA helicase HerA-like ATPase
MTPPEAPDPVAAAQAEAEAALAAAKAAQEAAEAAVRRAREAAEAACLAGRGTPTTRPIPAAAEPVASARLSLARVEEIRAGYAFEGRALELGALVNGEALPNVPVRIPLAMTNRHGLIAGATGTGKTRTLQLLAEQFSAHGVPVFAADIKGDLSGVGTAGTPNDKLLARTAEIGQDWQGAGFPVEYFSLGGRGNGVPIRATVAGFGPLLLSKVLGLNATQESSLGLVFHYAEKAGLTLLDLADLRAVLSYLISDEGKGELAGLGGLSSATVGVILRQLIPFADQGADVFFGEPEIDTTDFLRTTPSGAGVISLLEVPGVQHQPALYSTFLMWLLADLFNDLPEVGDLDQPKLVFFFDEAHLLFADASKEFLASITQTVRLIRSKGVGVFFVTQTPKDLPSDVLAQLGSRVQHQLRAFTPDDAAALRASVRTYPNSGYDLEEVLTVLGTGEAIITVMNERGAPSPVAWTRLRAPRGSMAASPDEVIHAAVADSPLLGRYGAALDRDSAREMLTSKLQAAHAAAEVGRLDAERAEAAEELRRQQEGSAERQAKEERRQRAEERAQRGRSGSSGRTPRPRAPKSAIEEILRSPATRTILTGVLSGIFGTRRRRHDG